MILEKAETQESPPPYVAAGVKPSNFVYVDRHHNGITDSYVVDPRMAIPASMLPPLDEGEEHITLLPANDAQRTTIRVKSKHGHVKCKLVGVPPSSYINLTRLEHRTSSSPFQLESYSKHGHLQIFLPRSFQGPVIVTTHHSHLKLSDALLPHQTPFTETSNTTRFFVGDTLPYFEKEVWTGDEAVLGSRSGHIWIGYEDEVNELPSLKDLFQRIHSKIWDRVL